MKCCILFLIISNSTFEDALPDKAVGVLGLGEKSCNPTCIDPIYTSIHKGISWADNVFTMCFGQRDGYLVIGTVDRRFQTGETVWAYQRQNELGYTYDVMDVRVNNETFYRNTVWVDKNMMMMIIMMIMKSDLYNR